MDHHEHLSPEKCCTSPIKQKQDRGTPNSNMGVIYGVGEQFKILTESNKNSLQRVNAKAIRRTLPT